MAKFLNETGLQEVWAKIKAAIPNVPSWALASTKPTYTKAEIGLGNVDNTSDADKPVSTAVQTALNAKASGKFIQVTLPSTGWTADTERAITATGVTATSNIILSPVPSSVENWLAADMLCVSQATDSLGFKCATVPTAEITVGVFIGG